MKLVSVDVKFSDCGKLESYQESNTIKNYNGYVEAEAGDFCNYFVTESTGRLYTY